MNRQHLTYVRAFALVMSCVVATLTICNLFTIATKSIEVDIPTEEDISWSIDPQQKEILFRTSFAVKNHGTYDISNIDVAAKLVKDNDKSLISFEKQDMIVLRGSDKTFDLLVSLDLDTISWFDWLSLMYNDTTLQLVLDIDASYMFGLVDFTVDEIIEIPWSPPIANLSENEMVKDGMNGVLNLLNIASNGSIPTMSDIFSLYTLPELNFTAENGFSFILNISDYSDAVKKITLSITTPLIVMDGKFVFNAEVLVGIEEGAPLFKVQEVAIQYVE
ncbi:MAG: hypothetical protein V3W20_01645 [Candidatus Neomarinimicrobiota bacterium]